MPFKSGHRGYFEWLGGFFDKGIMVGLAHLWHDTFPSASTISDSYSATKTALTGKVNKGKSTGSSGGKGQAKGSNGECGISCRSVGSSIDDLINDRNRL